MNDPPEHCPADSAADDLSKFEFWEIAEDVIRELREEGLLRQTPVNPAEQDAQSTKNSKKYCSINGGFQSNPALKGVSPAR